MLTLDKDFWQIAVQRRISSETLTTPTLPMSWKTLAHASADGAATDLTDDRFLADVDFNHAIVKGRRRREPAMDFLSANVAEIEAVRDPDVLALATEQNRILVPHDRQTMP